MISINSAVFTQSFQILNTKSLEESKSLLPSLIRLQRPTADGLRQHHFWLLGSELNVKPFILPLEDMKSYLLFGLEENRNHLFLKRLGPLALGAINIYQGLCRMLR